MLRVYYRPLSTFSQRVRIALLEKDIDTNYETGSGSDRFEYDVLAKGPEEGRTTTMPSRLKRRPGRACRSMHGAPGSSAFDATVL